MVHRENLTAVILAGGDNRRMNGQNKALLQLDGELLIERQIRVIQNITSNIIIITKPNFPFIQNKNVQVFVDPLLVGPLGGFSIALSHVKTKYVWLIGCDMPFISSKVASLMAKEIQQKKCQAIIPDIHGKLHPLHGIYDQSCIATIQRLLKIKEYAFKKLFENIRYGTLDEKYFTNQNVDQQFVFNMNTPEEYRNAKQMNEAGI